MFTGRVKEGSRGGSGNFRWDDVKADHHRENYLGHSLMASVGRWQKNRDLQWYGKDVEKPASQVDSDELKAIKEQEEELLAEALGVRPKRRVSSSVTKQELCQLTKDATAEVEAATGVGWNTRNTAGLYIKGGEMQKADSDEEDAGETVQQLPPPQSANRQTPLPVIPEEVRKSGEKKRKKEKKDKKSKHKKTHKRSSSGDDDDEPRRRRRRDSSEPRPDRGQRSSPPPRAGSSTKDSRDGYNRRDDYRRSDALRNRPF
ncbi:hypothetical protein SeMB42_g00310 [Synchytrium endobioticum]|uniref:Multiple myeloma tumor-associated protein 2-like N-terminal domain-containing protein n=1 Tax=Synchytrium endobioticum TaxID=286115 RepID=A0A507DHW8_9FUNG|nr:hypothetical protein SeLEV6574_g00660 [Synchytrium endobioticum]TPX54338.1 hypothetical protein SeMB42_g00310 [Synchytrium endobioticum]